MTKALPPLHVLQQDGAHGVGHVLAGVAALLHAVEDLRPHQHAHGVVVVLGVQLADDLEVQAVGLLLVGVHVHDELLERLRLLEVAEVHHGLVERHAALLDKAGELFRIVMHEVDVVHVEALHDVLDVVDDVVEVLRQLDDVLALDGRDEIGGHRLEDGVVDFVALVLDLVRAVHDAAQVLGLGEVLDGLDEQLGLFHRHRGLFFKGVEVVELVLLGH